eukprot:5157012-Alexandrium_andersonii.AAC.1
MPLASLPRRNVSGRCSTPGILQWLTSLRGASLRETNPRLAASPLLQARPSRRRRWRAASP